MRLLAVAVVAAILVIAAARALTLHGEESGGQLELGLVYDPDSQRGLGYLRAAYDSVLAEEGIPHRWISARDLVLTSGAGMIERFQGLVFADGLAQRVPTAALKRARDFARAGGVVMVVHDAGSRDLRGAFRRHGLLAPLLGVDYETFARTRAGAYFRGRTTVTPAGARRWEIPAAKLDSHRRFSGYGYGALRYPLARAVRLGGGARVDAASGSTPVLSERREGRGRAIWVNPPVAYLKAYSDDFPLRMALRRVVSAAAIPHVLPVPGGVGGLVVNWHVDSNFEWDGTRKMIRQRLFRRDVRADIDVTAGPDRDRTGDGVGFDACGRGTRFLQALARYGEIGDHGGWAHNLFALQLEQDRLSRQETRALVDRNTRCLRSVTHRPVRSYASPAGVHPQPMLTRVLDGLGIRSYYYTGDSGSAPNRTFASGRRVSDAAWAYPVVANGRYASVAEMVRRGHLSPGKLGAFLHSTLRYVQQARGIRLIYSHPYDLWRRPPYAAAYRRFLDEVVSEQRAHRLRVAPMPYFTNSLQRVVDTHASFTRSGQNLVVSLQGPRSLRGLSLQIPARWVRRDAPAPSGFGQRVAADGSRIITVLSDASSVGFELPLAAGAAR